jgi:DNA-binding response OmpR family regulator
MAMHDPNTTKPHPNILLAEDDRELRELLAFMLFRAGYRVTSCEDGGQLLDHLQNNNGTTFDLVLTDLRMPVLSGLDALRALGDTPVRPPVICMTAFGDAATHAAALKLGAAATIDKPFDLDQLVALVGSHCPATIHETKRTT